MTTAITYAVIGTSPFADVSVGAGPFRGITNARLAAAIEDLESKGYVTEIVELMALDEIDFVTNEED